MNPFLAILVVFLVVTAVLVLPLKMAAAAMAARRRDVFSCLLALVAAGLVQALGLNVPVYGPLIAFLLSALVFAAILGTGFIRGIGIALLYTLFSAVLLFALLALTGIGFAALSPWM